MEDLFIVKKSIKKPRKLHSKAYKLCNMTQSMCACVRVLVCACVLRVGLDDGCLDPCHLSMLIPVNIPVLNL